MSILGNIVEAGLHHLLCTQSGDILSIQIDLATQHLIHTEDGLCHLGSSGTNHACNAQDLARVHLQGNILKPIAAEVLKLQHRCLRVINIGFAYDFLLICGIR